MRRSTSTFSESTRPDVVIINALDTVPHRHSTTARGDPATVPSHTATMTPAVSTTREAASPRVGVLPSTPIASKHVNTGMEALEREG